MLKFINVQVRTCFNYPHLNNFTLHCTYITHALKYIEPVLGHIVHVPKSTHVQCTRNICAFSAFRGEARGGGGGFGG